MEKKIVSDLNPIYSEIYLSSLRESALRAYTKDLNLDGWIRSVDIFLIYDTLEELELAEKIVSELMTS